MRIAVAIDSFKGSLTTHEAGAAAREGILRAFPNAEVTVHPLADGGEGTVDTVVSVVGGELRTVTVCDPLGRPVKAAYGYLPERKTAVIEMSAAAGLPLLSESERDPMKTTTYGVGEMIADAIRLGCRRFLVGIGGSATNDGGVGMLQALGFSFLDERGEEIAQGAGGLASLCHIETAKALPALSECEFLVACDVDNPLCGERGCSAVYGPQKGATARTIPEMDAYLSKYAAMTASVLPRADANAEGAGAAGGMGFAFLAYLGGRLQSGIRLVMEETGLASHLAAADIVVTGEGRLDGQSCMGKAPVGVARAAKAYGKPVVAFSGCVTPDARACNDYGIDAFFPILRTPCSLAEAMDRTQAYRNLADTAEQVFLWYRTCAKMQ